MPVWPATLPEVPLLDGFGIDSPDVLVSTEMDAGVPKVRRRFTAGARRVQVSWVLDEEQQWTLELFVEIDLAGGALPWTGRHPLRDEEASLMFDPQALPTYSPLGAGLWKVSAGLLILP